MKAYSSNCEYFDDIVRLAHRMEQSGHHEAAEELRCGLLCLNGLTDGWAMLMEALHRMIATYGILLPIDQASDLKDICEVARRVVHRLE